MTRKPNLKQDDPEQSKLFLEAAKAAGVEDCQTSFEEAFARLKIRAKQGERNPNPSVAKKRGRGR